MRVYTLIVARVLLLAWALSGAVFAQPNPPEPPEEDESLKPREYAFNPVQARKEITAGNFYSRKGNHRAAAARYLEATRWDPGSTEAFLKWGEASEKFRDYRSAAEAYTRYIELAGNDKTAAELRQRMSRWPRTARSAPPPSKPPAQLDSVPDLRPPPPRSHR
jgi:tetratricopeptide (TPR) repeat protein